MHAARHVRSTSLVVSPKESAAQYHDRANGGMPDPLAPARGVLLGCGIGAAMWVGILLLIFG